MLVSEYFERVYEEIDKEGMPYFEEPDLLNRLKTAAYFFIDNNIEYLQNTQKAREDFSKLTIPFEIKTETNNLFILNQEFYRLQSLTAIYNSNQVALPIVQANDFETLKNDPFHSPTANEPLSRFYSGGFEVLPKPSSIKGLYLKHPTFGTNVTDDIIVEFPLNIQLFLIEKVVLHLMTTIGDQRYQMQFYQLKNNNTDS